jgi:hypothetical protein
MLIYLRNNACLNNYFTLANDVTVRNIEAVGVGREGTGGSNLFHVEYKNISR